MSDKLQSLPISGESTGEKSPTGEESTESAGVRGENLVGTSSSIPAANFDDSVFIALHGGSGMQNENCESDSKILDTVEVAIHPSVGTVSEGTTHFFPATMISSGTSANGNKVYLQTSQADRKPVLFLDESQDPQLKKRRLSKSVDGCDASGDTERELYLSIADKEILPITCKKNHALLYKAKLGSGKKGKCIKFEDEWFTPSEFENKSGLEMSKDWKRSLRYGGRSMQLLINKGYLHPHAATCTCSVCSDDESVTGPIRYFTPKVRRKRPMTSPLSIPHFTWTAENNHPNTAPLVQHAGTQQFVLPVVQRPAPDTTKQLCDEIPNSFAGLINAADIPFNSQTESIIQVIKESETAERRMWLELEEKAASMMGKLTKLQENIVRAKAQCDNKRNKLFKKVISLLENQKNPGMSNFKFDTSLGLKKSVDNGQVDGVDEEKLDDDNPDDDVTEICRACGRQAVSECTGCHKATYCSTECQEKDWHAGHRNVCRGLAKQGSADEAQGGTSDHFNDKLL